MPLRVVKAKGFRKAILALAGWEATEAEYQENYALLSESRMATTAYCLVPLGSLVGQTDGFVRWI